jgi:4-amino-4-deoxy-L-arabinose transferase-like glycosyltransferase
VDMKMTDNHKTPVFLDRVGLGLLLILALLLRSNLSYRTAFVDEALRIYEGWRILNGLPTQIMTYHFGWPVFSTVPLGFAGWHGGLEWARGLNVVWGVLTVLVVTLTARRLYGKMAGFIAGGMFAVFGSAIFTSTFATHDSLSIFWASLAVYFWVRGLTDDTVYPYALGSFFMVLGALTKYSAVSIALTTAVYACVLITGFFFWPRPPEKMNGGMAACRRAVAKFLAFLLPFLLLFAYGFVFRSELFALWQNQLLSKQSGASTIYLDILRGYLETLWLPLVLGLIALIRREGRHVRIGLLLIGISVLVYHLLNKTDEAMFKHECFMLLGLAPLAAGGIVALADLLNKRLRTLRKDAVAGLLGLAAVVYLGWSGQNMLPEWHSFWSDTSELLDYLRENVRQDDLILMEGGNVGNFYLRVRGVPGRVPAEIADTWWYEDEQGFGEEAYQRAIAEKRFDFIVLDNSLTPEFSAQFLPLILEEYDLVASFPAYQFGDEGQIDVFRPKDDLSKPLSRSGGESG